MLDRVDFDKKWFYITTVNASYIIVPGEEPPTRRCKHKSHLIKVMCLTAMARPRENPDRPGKFWDGKIGQWWFVEKYFAQRTTNNRVAGTELWRSVTVTKDVTSKYCVEFLLPAIVAKWPQWSAKRIRIQQHNATPRPKPSTDASINAKIAELVNEGWDIQFVTQPPNSPDCNVLDLAFFRAIQSIQYLTPSKDMVELMKNVNAAYAALPLKVCIKVWTTVQMVMNEILLANGNNNYKLPHAGKDKIVRELGKSIPLRLPCSALLLNAPLNSATIKSTMMPADGEFAALKYSLIVVSLLYLLSMSLRAVAWNATRRTEDSISPTTANYHSDEDDDLESVVADLMEHDAFNDIGTEDDMEMGEDVDDGDVEVEDITSALGLAQFFQHLEDNIEWGGHEYDHYRLSDAMVISDDDHNEG
jgi:hypothetical protein